MVTIGVAAVGGGLAAQGRLPPSPPSPPTAAAVPAHNRAEQRVPPPRPDASSAERRAKLLFDAIVRDDPALAQGVFFPRDAFLLVKDIRDPGRNFDQLHARFIADIHALHRTLPGLADARFDRFELARRGAFMRVHEEGNRLPYWASRHSVLHYTSRGEAHQLEVRVLITWDDQWYVIHLSEFH
jgi:hypothetical protein